MPAALMHSLELAAEAGDTTEDVYRRYFERCPESYVLMRHVDRYMKGRMLESVYLLLMANHVDEQTDYLRFESKQHLGYGVKTHMYQNLLSALRDTVQASIATNWTDEMQHDWDLRIDEILAAIRDSEAA